MGLLFEAFVRNFLRREQVRYSVDAPKVPWMVEASTESIRLLPEMKTDIVLTSETRRIVIETKYYATPHQAHHGTAKLISAHLYQLLTYLSHLAKTDGPEPEGLLLTPASTVCRRASLVTLLACAP